MTDNEVDIPIKELEIKAIIGFDGSAVGGFKVHPDGKHLVYSMGNKVSVQNWNTKEQFFLTGHTNVISTVDVSHSGKYIASGQINHIGFKARVIIWDFEKRCSLAEHELHKVRVEAVAFSKDDLYLVSLGGRDCGSVVVWDVNAGRAVCGTAASRGIQGEAAVIRTTNRRPACFITAGDNHLAVWIVNHSARSVRCVDVNTGKLKRQILCLDIDERDELCYCGTTTGDVLKLRLNFHHDSDILDPVKQPALVGCFARLSKKKLPRGSVNLYGQGVRSILRLFSGRLIVGAGDGIIELLEEAPPSLPHPDENIKLPSIPALKVIRSTTTHGSVTSLQLMDEGTTILAGTTNCEIFGIDMETFTTRLLVTCHTSIVYDVAFPHNFSEVFATASKNDVRVWSMDNFQELIRIRVPNFSCSSVVFAHNGKSILTAWNDGIIRSWTPLTGRLIYAILNAHNKGVSALDEASHSRLLVSGGCEGQVRLWEVTPTRQSLICTLKEHRAPVSSLHINKDDTEAVSASTDGTCIIWDLERRCRRQILFANTLFMCARFYPSGVQLLTGGSDRKIAYWEVLDGCLVRELEGSSSGTVNTLDISPDGETFVSAGNDQIVKLWKYQEGVTTHVGIGHSAVITAARFSPDQRHIVTASAAGSVFIWHFPKDEQKDEVKEEADSCKEAVPPLCVKEAGDSERKSKDGEEHVEDLPSTRSSKSSVSRKSICCKCKCTCGKTVQG